VLPDGSEQYVRFISDQFGKSTNIIETYSSGSTVPTRTNVFTYSTGSSGSRVGDFWLFFGVAAS
jgi:hypothetical protein